MDETRAAQLGEIATEASAERSVFLTDAASRFTRFLDDNAERLRGIGGLVLIDDDPEYLSLEADGTFSSRTRYQDDAGEWVTETETIETSAELIEIYNPADLYAAFADAARLEAGLPLEPTAAEAVLEPDADDDQIAHLGVPVDRDDAARMLYDLALTFQERSQRAEANLLDEFAESAQRLAEVLGSTQVIDDEDERIWFRADGTFEGEVLPASEEDDDDAAAPAIEAAWLAVSTPDDLVRYYDPTDLFGDLAEALAEEYPGVAPEVDETGEGDDDGA